MTNRNVAMIGLDTSHAVEFVRLMQDPNHQMVEGMRVVKAMRFASVFQSESGQDQRQRTLEQMGVNMVSGVEEAVDGVDAVFLEINDPGLHLEYYEQVVGYGLPVFIDKPLAATTAEGRRIATLAATHGTPTWSASSLRFIPSLIEAKNAVQQPLVAQTFGALGKAARGSDLVWYGVHAVEMAVAILGCGCESVRAHDDGTGVVLVTRYADERRGLVECRRGLYAYGGRIQSKQQVAFYDNGSGSPYAALMTALRDFVIEGRVPVPLDEAREVLGILEAGERSLASGKAETPLR